MAHKQLSTGPSPPGFTAAACGGAQPESAQSSAPADPAVAICQKFNAFCGITTAAIQFVKDALRWAPDHVPDAHQEW